MFHLAIIHLEGSKEKFPAMEAPKVLYPLPYPTHPSSKFLEKKYPTKLIMNKNKQINLGKTRHKINHREKSNWKNIK